MKIWRDWQWIVISGLKHSSDWNSHYRSFWRIFVDLLGPTVWLPSPLRTLSTLSRACVWGLLLSGTALGSFKRVWRVPNNLLPLAPWKLSDRKPLKSTAFNCGALRFRRAEIQRELILKFWLFVQKHTFYQKMLTFNWAHTERSVSEGSSKLSLSFGKSSAVDLSDGNLD